MATRNLKEVGGKTMVDGQKLHIRHMPVDKAATQIKALNYPK
ncbi:hypothetical protein ACYUJ6_07755 [Clostridium sp. JNZ X4-2]